ncbi:aminoglycoside phosphotransferase [Rhizobium sp. Root73]|uniref:bifunctional aminoglycoside phosphotransferase/ATP-binding protein n=1 Tax=unclassified Rhizobium TaxID=2613769 RepID=UPI0007265443|nr:MULTISPECIES: bifunctional aminoglycoside phosphotransferase/ATP-binding protein [unclassified Rhizobium]KQY12149.1 aminoglycoside phosphotransferase [Rhizobium sp. Root1334]KRC03972.1 aminoglycoside phosphotransferase [Rhizobium sp. Root73]
MITEDQSATISFLKDALSLNAAPVEMMDTHISRIFLVGQRAYKMKRAVKLPYADFSSAEKRLAACRKEVELNTLTAPGIYLGVKTVTRENSGDLALGGEGQLLDALVEMKRFDQSLLLDQIAISGGLTPTMVASLARAIVKFHRLAPIIYGSSGTANMAAVLKVNEDGFATSHVFSEKEVHDLTAAFNRRLTQLANLLDRRERSGKVRRCHGDLHLRNIFLLEGEPCLFDCIEFNDQIATTDILYDLAFLLMDLWHRGHLELANLVMNRYLDETEEDDGFGALPFFIAVRAAVRARVIATQAEDAGDLATTFAGEARSYFQLAQSLLQPAAGQLVAIGGLSGSGKSTLAETLAPRIGPAPGARIIESDRIRKAMHGVPPETRLPQAAYRPEISAKVYQEMVWRVRLILAEGGAAVADAVFDKRHHRQMFEKAAAEGRHPFSAFWLEADPALLRQRVAARVGGPSDATVEILAHQLSQETDDIQWLRMDATQPAETLCQDILRIIHGQRLVSDSMSESV